MAGSKHGPAETVVVLGGGIGGVSVANRLRRRLDRRHRVVLVNREPDFTFAASYLWVMSGKRRPSQVTRPLQVLKRRGIEVVIGDIENIDPASHTVTVEGTQVTADHLVVSLGADYADTIPGLQAAGETFATLDGARLLGPAVKAVTRGRVLVVTAAPLYRCPAAPYEAALLIDAMFRRSGVRGNVDVALHSAEPGPMAVAGANVSAALVRRVVVDAPVSKDARDWSRRMLHRNRIRQGRLRVRQLLCRTVAVREHPETSTLLAPGQGGIRVQRHEAVAVTAASPSDVIYLDHNATTPVAPEVLDSMLPYLTQHYGNPSSDHPLGHRAHEAVEVARDQVASLIGAAPTEIVFTSSGTESNNLAIRGSTAASDAARHRIVTSQVEHPATARPCDLLEAQGWTVTCLPVTGSGTLDPDTVIQALDTDVALMTVMLAQNETGAIMPVSAPAAAARTFGIVTHTDAAQAIGKMHVNVDTLGIDLLSIAGHKCYAPKGIGALYVRSGTPLQPVLLGADQERGLRPGTENVASIVGLGAACCLAQARLDMEGQRLRKLRDELWQKLVGTIPGLVRHTPEKNALPNTLMVSFPAVLGHDVLTNADRVAASTGSACHSGLHTPSATLLAMGVSPDIALGAVRLSLGHDTTAIDIATAADILIGAYANLLPTPLEHAPQERTR